MSSILIKDALILPMDKVPGQGELYFKGSLGVKDNRITFIAHSEDEDYLQAIDAFEKAHAEDELQVLDGEGFALMPGLINTHTHVAMTLMRSYADDMPLMEWLETKVWPFEGKLKQEDIRIGTELGISEMLLSGTTTFVDMYYHQLTVGQVAERSGSRAVIAPFFTDFNVESFKADFNACLEKYGTQKHPRIDLMVSAHAAYTCSEELLKYGQSLCEEHNLPLNIHLAETLSEQEIIKGKYGLSPTQFLDKLGLLNSNTLAAHGVYLSPEDRAILRERGVSIAHNPQSNMKLASGISPVSTLIEEGVNVALGTDGACSNNDLDMWEEMRSASFLQKVNEKNPCAMDAYTTLCMATKWGAKAISREQDLGTLSLGKLADMIMIDLRKAHLTPLHNLVASLAYCAKGSDVETVIVDGQVVVQGGKLLTMNLSEIIQKAQKCVDALCGE